MKPWIVRSVASILVLCLILDPATAAAFTCSYPTHHPIVVSETAFEVQALTVVSRYFLRPIQAYKVLFRNTRLTSSMRLVAPQPIIHWERWRIATLGALVGLGGILALVVGRSATLAVSGLMLIASTLITTEWTIPGTPQVVTAYSRLLEGIGLRTPDWARMNALTAVVLEAAADGKKMKLGDLETAGVQKFQDMRIPADKSRIQPLLQPLVDNHVLRESQNTYELALPVEEAAVKMEAVYFIKTQIEASIHGGDSELLKQLLIRYAKAVERWPLYPVENKTPVLKAIAVMTPADKEVLLKALQSDESLREYPLVDSIRILLEKSVPTNWLQRHVSHLEGKTIWSIAAEGWFPAGGLGRVQQYHSAAMQLLASHSKMRVATIEPYYPYRVKVRPGEEDLIERVDYSQYQDLATPIKDLKEIDSFFVKVQGKDVKAQVFKGTNEYGIDVYLIKDAGDIYTRIIYRYGEHGAATWEEFSEFFSRASLELIRRTEQAKQDSVGEKAYQAPVIIANDGQLGLLPLFKRMLDEENPLLRKALVWFTTHTYRNRMPGHLKYQRDILKRMHIPEKWWRYFERIGEIDFTSAGVRLADGASAVGAVHRDEVSRIDPDTRLLAITNGDNRFATRRAYLKIWHSLHRGSDLDPEDPTPEQLIQVNKIAKRRLGLNPDQMVIGYYGRLVPEKFDIDRTHIMELVKAGVQVVIYGNVQAPPPSQELYAKMSKLVREVNGVGPGKLIFNPSWTQNEQVEALVATDLQLQISARDPEMGTEAEGAKESNAPAVGAREATTPYREGGLQAQGVLYDSAHRFGNVIVPLSESPEDYLKLLMAEVTDYQMDPKAYAALQVQSMKFSQSTDAVFTGAAYLRAFNQAIEWQENPLLVVQAYLRHELDMDKYFTPFWVRNNLVDYLKTNPKIATPLKTDGRGEVYVIHPTGEPPYLLALSRDEVVHVSDKKWMTTYYDVPAFRKLFGWDLGVNRFTKFQAFDRHTGELYPMVHTLEEVLKGGWDFGVPWPGIQVIMPDFINVPGRHLDDFTATETFLLVRRIWQHYNDPQKNRKEKFASILNLSPLEARNRLGDSGIRLILGAIAVFGTKKDLDQVEAWDRNEVESLRRKLSAGRNDFIVIEYIAEFLRQMLGIDERMKLLDAPFRQGLAGYIRTLSSKHIKRLTSTNPEIEITGFSDGEDRYVIAINMGESVNATTRFMLDDVAIKFFGARLAEPLQVYARDLVTPMSLWPVSVKGIDMDVPAARILQLVPPIVPKNRKPSSGLPGTLGVAGAALSALSLRYLSDFNLSLSNRPPLATWLAGNSLPGVVLHPWISGILTAGGIVIVFLSLVRHDHRLREGLSTSKRVLAMAV